MLRQATHVTVLVSVLVHKRTVLARPACTTGGMGHINHVHVPWSSWLWRGGWGGNILTVSIDSWYDILIDKRENKITIRNLLLLKQQKKEYTAGAWSQFYSNRTVKKIVVELVKKKLNQSVPAYGPSLWRLGEFNKQKKTNKKKNKTRWKENNRKEKKDIVGTILPFATCISCITVHHCSLLLQRRANSASLFLIAIHRSPKWSCHNTNNQQKWDMKTLTYIKCEKK